MTTAEDWIRHINGEYKDSPLATVDVETIAMIQADALREAAEIALNPKQYSVGPLSLTKKAWKISHDAILARAKEVEKP